MARRRARRSSRRSNSARLFKKRAGCPTSIKRVCKTTAKKGQVCQVVAGTYKSKWFSAGVSQRRAINLQSRLSKSKGCRPTLHTSLGRR